MRNKNAFIEDLTALMIETGAEVAVYGIRNSDGYDEIIETPLDATFYGDRIDFESDLETYKDAVAVYTLVLFSKR